DQFARELLISNGSNFRVAPVNFLRAVPNKTPEGVAQMVALSLMGTRTETWPKDQAKNLAVFFSRVGYKSTLEWKEEIVYFDQTKSNGEVTIGTFPDGTTARLLPDRDPREAFADWLITPKNKWFTRNIANRAWSWFMGRGIIHEPDDIRPDNPAQNPELLALLEKEMVNSKYDMKKLFRFILNSQTYQLSCIPRSKKPEAEANFAEYPLRRLEAEVLIDALDNITSSTEKYSSPIPEPFTFVPEEKRSITLSDGSITSPFLEMFGRPARDTGWESERNNHPSADQRLHFLNSTHVQRKIEQSKKLKAILETYQKRPRDLVDQIYLTILSRLPSEEELRLVQLYTQNTPPAAKREAAVDLIWALINTDEFLYRH
ncbi:TPA: hypothetical protein DDW35_05135, partial [Candidatus Sumerlaeota bacterium]|nr:hypothetical protein [Candidatus Sumerlaeota bacterium]